MFYENFKEWYEANRDNVFRYVVFKKMFTPYEVQSAFMDESIYESDMYSFCKIEEVVDLKNGEWLLGLYSIEEDSFEPYGEVKFYKLSEIRLERFHRNNGLKQSETETNWIKFDE